MAAITLNKNEIWDLIKDIPDPEIPVLTIEELGVLRNVEIKDNNEVIVSITPTYIGCPAMNVFESDILKTLRENHIGNVHIKTVFDPPWTTDTMSEAAKKKLQSYGIAPPEKTADKSAITGQPKSVTCPKCKSKNTQLKSQFGSTACKALYICNDCHEPFEYFKCM